MRARSPSARAPAAAALLGAALWLLGSTAQAYCLTTTCDTGAESCEIDADGCSASGFPLQWSSLCLDYGVQRDGSERRQIDASVLADLMDQAFSAWMDADCGSGTPPVVVQSIGEVSCAKPEFNCASGDHNSNTVLFRDSIWHYDPAALAITTLTVDTRDGTILDADMEINSLGFNFSVGDEFVNNDLLSVVTHEAGHFLGLSHSQVDGSTMFPGYSSRDTTQRTLSDDDIAGICEIYPGRRSEESCSSLQIPDSTTCLGGSECSEDDDKETRKSGNRCTLSLSGAPAGWGGASSVIIAALLVLARRRPPVTRGL